MKTTALAAALACLPIALPLLAPAQGPLNPPGPPAPAMKSLEQVEPRIPINVATAPGEVGYQHRISQPGSYYLTADLTITAPSGGIQIIAEGVTLDLNGFTISRGSGSSASEGITIVNPRVTIRNGRVRGFNDGIRASSARNCAVRDVEVSNCSGAGIALLGESALVDSCRAFNNGSYGILTGARASITNCLASENAGFAAIAGGEGARISNCTAAANSGENGISAGGGSTVSNCSARSNRGPAVVLTGIRAGSGSVVTECNASENSSSSSTSVLAGVGFQLGSNSTLQKCVAESNKGDGVRSSGGSLIRNNLSSNNGNGGSGAGIHVLGGGSRIESNNVVNNDVGYDVDNGGNLLIKNSAADNTTNYIIAGSNRYGAIVNLTATGSDNVNGNSAAATTSTSDPWANFAY